MKNIDATGAMEGGGGFAPDPICRDHEPNSAVTRAEQSAPRARSGSGIDRVALTQRRVSIDLFWVGHGWGRGLTLRHSGGFCYPLALPQRLRIRMALI